MPDISIIILTYNEEIHIKRCIESVMPIAKEIFIVDSFSTDATADIATNLGVKVLKNKWENNHAKQFNWALENCPIKTEWVLRLDADEYLTPELIEEIKQRISTLSEDVTGVIFKRRHIFMNQWMKRGIYPVKLLRLFRHKQGRCEQRLMDEHIYLESGTAIEFDNDFCDHNLNNLSWFCHKHIDYAIREAAEMLDIEYNISGLRNFNDNIAINDQAKKKRINKLRYAKLPLFIRPVLYFLYRYILRGAILEGKVGFIWTFMQGLWYRTLVDAKIFEIKSICRDDKDAISSHLSTHYNIHLTPHSNK